MFIDQILDQNLMIQIYFLDQNLDFTQKWSKNFQPVISVSIRERFRYFKQKREKPNFSALKNDLVKTSARILGSSPLFKSDVGVWELESGLILARGLLSDSLIEELTNQCLTDFPTRPDSKTNVGKLGKPVRSVFFTGQHKFRQKSFSHREICPHAVFTHFCTKFVP